MKKKKKVDIHKKHSIRNIAVLIISIIVAILIANSNLFHTLSMALGAFGYIGAVIGGMLFVSTFTVAIGAAILTTLIGSHNLIFLSIAGGVGAVMGDLIVFRLVKYTVIDEIRLLYYELGGYNLNVLLKTKYFAWTLPLIGAFFIASPLPDEIGISLMGLSSIKQSNFIILSFILNTIGIFLLLSFVNSL